MLFVVEDPFFSERNSLWCLTSSGNRVRCWWKRLAELMQISEVNVSFTCLIIFKPSTGYIIVAIFAHRRWLPERMSRSHNYVPNHVNENLRDRVVNPSMVHRLFATTESLDIQAKLEIIYKVREKGKKKQEEENINGVNI